MPVAAVLAPAFLLGSLLIPRDAQASAKGRRNTAIALGAIAAHQLLTGKTRNGIIAGAGAAYAYKRYNDARKDENRRRRVSEYRSYYDDRDDPGYRTSNYSRHRSYSNDSYRSTPPGWSRGKKTGWRGGSLPPGLAKKQYRGY